MNSFAIIGLGRFGLEIAEKLYEYGKDVMAIDRSSSLINSLSNKVTRAVVADGKDFEALKSLGVADCDCVIITIGSDIGTSVLTTMNVKKLGVKKIICKAHDDTHRDILEKLGADEIIIPERETAAKKAHLLAAPNILEEIELSDDYGLIECKVPLSWIGKTIRDLNIRKKHNITVVAAKDEEKITVSPLADYKFKIGSSLVLLGEYKDLDKFKK